MASLDQLQNFYKQTLALACGAGAVKIYVSALPTPATGYLVISPTNSAKREIVFYDSTGTDGTGMYVNIPNTGSRGMGGTTAQAHDALESIRMNLTSLHWADVITAIQSIIAGGAVDASTSAKGITKLSVAPAVATSPIAVGVNDPKVPTADPTTLFAPISVTTPSGIIAAYAGASAPAGWLIADGSAVSRTGANAALFAAISTNYGAGDGSTTFNLPDLRGRAPIGVGTGTKVLSLAATAISSNQITVPTNHGLYQGQTVIFNGSGVTGLTTATQYYVIIVDATHVRLANSQNSANNASPLTISGTPTSANFTITLTARTLADVGGEESHALSLVETAAHSHRPASTTSFYVTGSANGGLQGGSSANTTQVPAQTSTENSGGDGLHNTMQPFLALNYIIKL